MYYWRRKISTTFIDDRGVVAVETALYFVVFFMLCALLVDFSTVFLNQGHLERVNHSLASILRERTRFYGGDEALTQENVEELNRLAARLLADSRIGNNYQLLVGVVYFEGNSNQNKKIKSTQLFTSGTQPCQTGAPALDNAMLTELSPWIENVTLMGASQRWLPVYQVTLCIPGGESLFSRFLSLTGKRLGDISASNAVIPR